MMPEIKEAIKSCLQLFPFKTSSFGTSQNSSVFLWIISVSSVVKKETTEGIKEGTETHRDLLVHDRFLSVQLTPKL